MKTQSAKAKGRRLQGWLRDKILEYFPLEEDDVLSRSMGASGSDLHLSPRAREYFDFDCECKNVEKIRLWESWDQACQHGRKPLLVIKKNYREPLAILRAEDLLSLLKDNNVT